MRYKLLIIVLIYMLFNLKVYSNSYKYIDLGVDSRSFSIGDSAINIVKGSGSPLINPAGIGEYNYNWILISHLNWIFDSTLDNIEIGVPLKNGFVISSGLLYFSTGSFNILNSNGDISYTLNSYDASLYLGIGRKIGILKAGVNNKLLIKNIGDYSGNGFSMDIGIRVSPSYEKSRFNINIVLKNVLYKPISLIKFDNQINREFLAGVDIKIIQGLKILSSLKIGDMPPSYSVSILYNFQKRLSIFSGYNISEFNSVGAGLSYKYIIEKRRVIFLEAGYLKILDNNLNDETPLRLSIRYIY